MKQGTIPTESELPPCPVLYPAKVKKFTMEGVKKQAELI